VDHKAGLDEIEKWKFLTLPGLASDPSVVQPLASRYTDYAIPALSLGIAMLILLYRMQKKDNVIKHNIIQNGFIWRRAGNICGLHEHYNITSNSIKDGEFLEQLRNY
jgi:hypothetical protein